MNQNDPTGTIKTHLIGALDDDGKITPLLKSDFSNNTEGNNDENINGATSANQQTQIDKLEEIAGQTTSFDGVDTFFSVGYSALQLLINLGTKSESAALTDTGQGSVIAILKRLLSVKLLTKTQTPSFTSVTSSGTVAAGATSISIANNGDAAGIVDGASLPAGTSIEWTANWINVLGSVSYDATGTSFLISEVR